MRLSLLTKLAIAILGTVVLTSGAMSVIQHVLYSRTFAGVLGKIQTGSNELQQASAVDILQEIAMATEGSLARGEREVFKDFAKKQNRLKAIEEFSLYGRSGTIELSSKQERVGQQVEAAIWSKAQSTKDHFLIENDNEYAFYQPLHVDADLRRLHPDWKIGDLFGILRLRVSKDRINAMLGEAEADYRASSNRVVMIVVVSIVVAVGLAFAIALLLCNVMLRPLRNTVQAMERVAAGDYTQQVIVHAKDEFGRMATAVNSAVKATADAMRRVRENTESLAGFAGQLSDTATQLANGAEETTSQSTQVAAAAEQMTTNMTAAATATEEMSTNVKVVATAVEELTASISDVAKSAEQASGVARNAAQLATASNTQIGELGVAANAIGSVIEVIREIAEQTNLLALNATIEAARAGEAGKGFAVVATEVKELAKQTGEATEDIRKRIEAIQGATGQAVQSINNISEIIHRVDQLSHTIAAAVEEQSTTTKEIARNVAQSSTVAATVARGVAESASASREISQTIVGVDQAAKRAAQGACQAQTASQELSRMADTLQALVGQFSV